MKKQAFTLIELLVVISIISLLSSIVLASLNSARQKADISSGLAFAENMQHAYGQNALGIWEFDEGSGSVVADTSGAGRSGTFSGTSIWTPSGVKNGAIEPDGFNYVNLPNLGNRLDLVGGQNGKILIMAWIRPTQYIPGGYSTIAATFPGFLYFSVNPNRRLQLMVYDTVNGVNFWPQSSAVIPLNKWTHVAFLLEGGIGYKFYINGRLDSSVSNSNLGLVNFNGYGGYTRIGAAYNVTPVQSEIWVGDIDSVRVYYPSLD